MEDFAQTDRHRTVIRIRRHDRAHVFPPALTLRRCRDGGPARFIFDFGVAKKLPGFRVEKDRIVVHAMGRQNRFEFRPDWAMAPLILGLLTGIHTHNKGFSDHLKRGIWDGRSDDVTAGGSHKEARASPVW